MDVYTAFDVDSGQGSTYVVKARRQVGKSILAEVLLIKFGLTKKCTSALIEPTLNQSRRVFKQLVSLLEGSGVIKSANGSLLTIEFVNGSEILFKSAEQLEGLRGMTISGLLVIDEAAFIADEVFEILYPTVDVHRAPIFVISTPLFKDGKFFQLFENENNIVFDWSKYDTSKYLSPERLEQYRNEMSDIKFRSEYLGEFIEDGSFVFSNISNCIKDSEKEPIYAGVDWAVGNNGDYTVVTLMDEDATVTKIEAFNNIEPSEQIGIISRIINDTPTLKKVQVEQNSIGAVYFDYLKRAVSKPQIITVFNTSNESKRRIIEQLASGFAKGTVGIPNDGELLRELNHFAVTKTPTGKVTYEGVGAHDDYCMSLAFAYDLASGGNNAGVYNIYFSKKNKNNSKHRN